MATAIKGGGQVPKVSKENATKGGDHGVVVDRAEELDGYTVNFVTFRQDIDHGPFLKGLPDDRCQCPHWGYVIKGKVTYHYGDHSETIEAGEAYFAPPGHTPELHAGTELVEFSPSHELERTLEVVMGNVEAMQGASS